MKEVLILCKQAMNALNTKDRKKIWLSVPLTIIMGLFEIIGIALLGTVGTIAFRIIAKDNSPSRLETILSDVFPTHPTGTNLLLLLTCLAMFFLGAKTISQAALSRKLTKFLARIEADLSSDLYRKIINSELIQINKYNFGEIQYVLSTGTSRLISGIVNSVINLWADSFSAALMAMFAFYASPLVFTLTFSVLLLTYLIFNIPISKKTRVIGKEMYIAGTKLAEDLLESIKGIREIKGYKLEDSYFSTYRELKRKFANDGQQAAWLNGSIKYLLEIAILIIGFLVVVVLAATSDVRHAVTILVLYVAIGFRIIPSIQRIQASISSIRLSKGMTESYFEMDKFFTKSKKIDPVSLEKALNSSPSSIIAKSIYFKYPNNESKWVLEDVNFELKHGNTMLILGPSGSGKSTLVDILMGANNPLDGSIEFLYKDSDGIENIGPRPSVGFVSQESALLGVDIYQNVSLKNHNSSQEQNKIRALLGQFKLIKFTQAEEASTLNIRADGVTLSGGERQRISIARAAYSSASILIFDEPTSALDLENRQIIIDLIKSNSRKVTQIIISHSNEFIQTADCILELKSGIGTYYKDIETFQANSRWGQSNLNED
jgi:ABC-type bacteriocin/lantibiotic exporter with double-glycine peptidase domain